jgi:hypothetical protein
MFSGVGVGFTAQMIPAPIAKPISNVAIAIVYVLFIVIPHTSVLGCRFKTFVYRALMEKGAKQAKNSS